MDVKHALRATANHVLQRSDFLAMGILRHAKAAVRRNNHAVPTSQYKWSNRPRYPEGYWECPDLHRNADFNFCPNDDYPSPLAGSVYGSLWRYLAIETTGLDSFTVRLCSLNSARRSGPIRLPSVRRALLPRLVVPRKTLDEQQFSLPQDERRFRYFLSVTSRYTRHYIANPRTGGELKPAVLHHLQHFGLNQAIMSQPNSKRLYTDGKSILKNWSAGLDRPSALDSERDPHFVSVICMTMRPELLPRLAKTLAQQVGVRIQLVLGTHGFTINSKDLIQLQASVHQVEATTISSTMTLGEGLNQLLARAESHIVARLDDDDIYGPRYLAERCHALEHSKAQICGVKNALFYLEEEEELRYLPIGPDIGYANSFIGSSLVARTSFARALRGFPSTAVGEDSGLNDKARKLTPLLMVPTTNYVVCRRDTAEHTFKMEANRYRLKTQLVSCGPEAKTNIR